MFSMISKFLLFVIFCPIVLSEDSEAVKTLCRHTWINAADRLPNNTYRVYRGEYYWELSGLPQTPAKVRGPFRPSYQDWWPIEDGNCLTTVTGKHNKSGVLYRYSLNKVWGWAPNGSKILGGKEGQTYTYHFDREVQNELNSNKL